jgi:hypothetical protein
MPLGIPRSGERTTIHALEAVELESPGSERRFERAIG